MASFSGDRQKKYNDSRSSLIWSHLYSPKLGKFEKTNPTQLLKDITPDDVMEIKPMVLGKGAGVQ